MKSMKRKQAGHSTIERYFNRKFEFRKDRTWSLPNNIYQTEKFMIPECQQRKHKLNSVKAQLSNLDIIEWTRHTKRREPSTSVISNIKRTYRAELVTQAWCKFYECLFEYPVITENLEINSVHLCEAPGAFICALNHYLKIQYPNIKWNWIGNSLNPYYEGTEDMIPDDRLIRDTYANWHFGLDLTGDITKYYNHQSLVNFVRSKRKVHLVTADGSVDCSHDPGEQEIIVSYLQYCETITALQLLETGGTFVIKIFTMFEESTICLMYLLNFCFEKVHVFKPCSSKGGNSESYVICLNFKALDPSVMKELTKPYENGNLEKSMFSLDSISESFLSQIYECSDFFMESQMNIINENVKYFMKMDYKQSCWIKDLRNKFCTFYESKYYICALPVELRLVQDYNINNNLYNMAEHFLTSEDEYLYKKIDVNDLFHGDINTVLDIQTGKYILTIGHSKYHTIKNYSYNQNKKQGDLFKLSLLHLKNKYNVFAFSDFEQFYGASKFHRTFFLEIFNKFSDGKDIIIIGIPLLTNFLVGLLFLLSLAFKHVVFLNNTIILDCLDCTKAEIISKHLELINKTYLYIDGTSEVFTRDILFVVGLSHVYNKRFVKPMSIYNDNILKYRY